MPIEVVGIFVLVLISAGLYLTYRAVRSAKVDSGDRRQADAFRDIFKW